MKKILAILLILVLALTSMVSCDKIPGLDKVELPELKLPFDIKLPWAKDEAEGPTLDAAKTYLFNTYKDSAKNTLVDYDVVAKVIIDGTTFTVTWSTNLESITVKESSKANFWTIDLPAANETEVAYVLTATISDADGNKVEVKFDKVLPAFKENTNVAVGPQVGKAYNLTFYHPGVEGGSNFYIVGYMTGYYFQTSTDSDETLGYKERVNVYVEEAEGGYYMYCMYYGQKLYIDMYINGNYVNGRFAETPGVVYTYDETLKTYVATIADQEYMFGVKTAPKDDGSYYTTIGPVPTNAPDSYYWLTFVESTTPDLPAAEYTTPEEIVNAAYALEEGKTLYGGMFTLTGVITQITDAYTSQYKNVTAIIQVGNLSDKLITCYRIKGTGADQIAVGDTITVTGIIVNYKGTIEFNSGSSLDSFTKAEGGGEGTPTIEVNPIPTPVIPEGTKVDFDFGPNGDAAHADGESLADGATTTTYTSGDYTLTLTDVEKVQFGGFDAKGNSIIKFGNSSAAGTITFVVPDNVKAVVIYAARYKSYADNSIIVVNGTYYSLAKNSNDGEYEAIVVDTTTNKTVVIASAVVTSGKARMVINTISYIVAECAHNYESVETPATCTTAGKTTYTCSLCGDIYEEAGDAATNHVGTTVAKGAVEATCLVEGFTAGEWCTECQKYITDPVSIGKAEHSWGDDDNCIWCQTPSHVCEYDILVEVVAPTCLTDGYTVYKCSCEQVDPNTTERDVVKTNGHQYGEGVVTNPTCVADGYTTYTCTVCTADTENHTKVEPGEAATGVHTPGAEATCTADQTCTVCSEVLVEKLGHTPGAEATCETAQICDVCFATLAAAKGHKYGEWTPNGDDTHSATCANDASHVKTIATGDLLAEMYATAKDTTYGNAVLEGVIVSIDTAYNSQFGNISVWIQIGDYKDHRILCYRLKGDAAANLKVGDIIKVSGTIKNYGGKIEFDAGCTILEYTAHTEHTYSDATCLEPATCTICGYVENEELGEHSFVEGVCSVCNYEEGTEEKEKITASKTYEQLKTENPNWTIGGNTATKVSTLTIDENVTVTVSSGGNSGKVYSESMRIYASDSPAGTLTISVAEGYELVSIKITTVTGTYAFLYVEGTTTDICNKTVSVSGSSVLLQSAQNGSSGKQVRVTAIEVVYQAV